MAEWLRRLTRNQMGSSRVGSNPTRSGRILECCESIGSITLSISLVLSAPLAQSVRASYLYVSTD